MLRLSAAAIRRPWLTLGCAGVLALAALPGLARVRLWTDGLALVPAEVPEIVFDREVRATFGIRDPIVLVIETRDARGIFNPATIALVARLTRAVGALDEIGPDRVVSLANEMSARRHPESGAFLRYLDPLPASAVEIAELRRELFDLGVYTGTLVSLDGGASRADDWRPSAAALLVGIDASAERSRWIARVRAVVAAQASAADVIHVTGAPVAEVELGFHLLEDLAILIPLSMLAMAAVFYFRYRSVGAVLLPLLEVGAALVFTFGCMGYLGVPIYLTVTVMPAILAAVGITDEIHLFARFEQSLRAEPAIARRARVLALMTDLTPAVLKASLTTAIGFLSFAVATIPAVQAFGIFTALGTVYCLFYTLTVIPAFLVLIPERRLVPARRTQVAARAPLVARVGMWAAGGRGWVLAVVCLLVGGAVFGIRAIKVQDSWESGFSASSRLASATQRVDALFHGAHVLQICLDARPGSVTGASIAADSSRPLGGLPERLSLTCADSGTPALSPGARLIVRARARLRSGRPLTASTQPDALDDFLLVAVVESVARVGAETKAVLRCEQDPLYPARLTQELSGWEFTARGERFLDPQLLARVGELEETVRAHLSPSGGGVLGPYEQLAITRYLLFHKQPGARRGGTTPREVRALLAHYGQVRGAARRGELMAPDHNRVLVTVFLKHANFADTAQLLAAIDAFQCERLAPLGVTAGLAGDVAVSQAMIGAIVDTQTRSLVLAVLGNALVIIVLGRSLRWGLLAVVPASLAVLATFAVLGFAGIPLGVATSMFASMTLGIGVDFAIHIIEVYRRELKTGVRAPAALEAALRSTGPGILVDASAIMIGFGILLVSAVPASARLGLVSLTAIGACLVATILVLPGWMLAATQDRERARG